MNRCHMFLFGLLLLTTPCLSADGDFGIGSRLPEFPELTTIDDQEVERNIFQSANVFILVFTCNRCPYAKDYEERLNVLQDFCRQSDGKVVLLAVNSNYGRDESLKAMKRRAEAVGFEFLYAKDKDQSLARSVGAIYTPEFFVFDAERRLAYKGALDDSTNPEQATVNYVRQATTDLLRGESVRTKEAGARGCTIRFRRERKTKS